MCLRALLLIWRIGLSLFDAGHLPSLVTSSLQPYYPSGFRERQQLLLRDGLGTARDTGEKEFTINLRAVVSFEHLHSHYTLFNSPSWAFQQGRVPRTVPCIKRTVLSLVTLVVAVTHGGAQGCPGGGDERSWRSRSWNSTRYHRAGPAGSGHSWQGGAGPHTLCSGPQRDSQ